MRRSNPMLAAAALASLALGCARAHLQRSFGQSTEAALMQQAPARTGAKGAVSGLDSEEAEIIADAYRRSLAPKEVKVTEEPVIYVAPPSAYSARAPALAPSVPKEQNR